MTEKLSSNNLFIEKIKVNVRSMYPDDQLESKQTKIKQLFSHHSPVTLGK